MPSQDLLLDTHVWIWLVNGDATLGPRSQAALTAASVQGRLLVSAISVWELGRLEAKGRISLSQPCLQWVQQALSLPGIVLAPLTPEIAVESSRLPGSFHGDPADRILVATARVTGAAIATRDQRIIDYAAQSHLTVLPI